MEEEKVEEHAEDARSRGRGGESRERRGGSIEEGIGEAGGSLRAAGLIGCLSLSHSSRVFK